MIRYAIFVLLWLVAMAARHTWIGAVSDRVSDDANWSGGSPAGDPEAVIVFAGYAMRFNVVNDVPGLRFKELSFASDQYTLSGARLVAEDAWIRGAGEIACDLQVSGTLAVRVYPTLTFSGAISGSGGLNLGGGRTVFSGTRSNSYRGKTVISGDLHLQKSRGAIALPAETRFARWLAGVIYVDAPDQIAHG